MFPPVDTTWLSQSQFFGVGVLFMILVAAIRARRASLEISTVAVSLTYTLGCAAVGGRALAWYLEPAMPSPLNLLTPGYASLGAAAGIVVGWFPVWRFYPRSWTLLDTLTPALFVGVAITRIGCLAQGCDFGVPWRYGITYRAPAAAWQVHASTGLIPWDSQLSAPVFPFPVVMASIGLAAACLGLRSDPRPGVAAARAMVLYLGLRVWVELFRAVPPDYRVGLNTQSLGAFLGLIAASFVLRHRARSAA